MSNERLNHTVPKGPSQKWLQEPQSPSSSSRQSPSVSLQQEISSPNGLLSPSQSIQLQQAVGNQALLRYIRSSPSIKGASSTVVQRFKDKDNKEVTIERVQAENNLDTLREWEGIDNEEWDSEEEEAVKEAIARRIEELRSEKRELSIAQDKEALEKTIGVELTNYDPHTDMQLKALRKVDRAKFFAECMAGSVSPGIIANGISGASTSEKSANRALFAFAGGAPYQSCLRLAQEYDALMALRMNTIQVDHIVSLLAEGFLDVSKHTYCDNPRKSGSVYMFHIPMTNDTLLTEWHVHWGPQNRVEAASFKNNRMATGEGARVTTDDSDNKKLRSALGSLWGP